MRDNASVTELVDAYCAIWCEPDAAVRQRQLTAMWAQNGTYSDPTADSLNRDQLLAHIEKVLARRPGGRVLRTSAVDHHHRWAMFAWHVELPDGATLTGSIDLLELDADGRIKTVVGFFGPLAIERPILK